VHDEGSRQAERRIGDDGLYVGWGLASIQEIDSISGYVIGDDMQPVLTKHDGDGIIITATRIPTATE
jgi:hypothetical protein